MARLRVTVVGGGVIGLSLAWRLAQRGAQVTLFEREKEPREASFASAGMIAAQAEGHGSHALFELALHSRSLMPDFVGELEQVTGAQVHHQAMGLLMLGRDVQHGADLEKQVQGHVARGLSARWLSSKEAKAEEPGLGEAPFGAALFPQDGRLDARLLLAALLQACARSGVLLRLGVPVERVLEPESGHPGLLAAGGAHRADAVVLAAGSWTSLLPGVPLAPGFIRPVRGQMLRLRVSPAPLSHVVFGIGGYLVPRPTDDLLVGSTMEEAGFAKDVTVGGVGHLASFAARTVPQLASAPVLDSWSGLRPASQDGLPLLGAAPVRGLFAATGHLRNGIILAPATASLMADLILEGREHPLLAPFGSRRALQPWVSHAA